MDRSALFLMGGTGADFIKFIDSIVPQDRTVIVPERSGMISHQNILQFYLHPRAIVACSCDSLGGKCYACLLKPDAYVPVTSEFPPSGSMDATKELIPFPGKSDYYLGIYAPAGDSIGNIAAADTGTANQPVAIIIDLLVLGVFSLIGAHLARLVVPRLSWLETLALSIPLGAGALTWVVFVASWAGAPISLGSVGIAAVALLAALVYIRWRSRGKETLLREKISWDRKNTLQGMILGGILLVFSLATVIAVGRTYSSYDDIANWALKGYAIAYQGTIWAGADWGGHALAYPMNLPLSISFFKLASGDVLPGSKLLFPLSLAALLVGCYAFWNRLGVRNSLAQAGILFLLTVPTIFLHSTLGYANIPFTAYLVLGVLWAIEGVWSGRSGDLTLSGILFAFAAWTRPEGIILAFIMAGVIIFAKMVMRRSGKVPLLWLLPLMILPGVWLVFSSGYIGGDQIGGAVSAFLQQALSGHLDLTPLPMSLAYAVKQGMSPVIWGVVLPGSLALLVLSVFRIKQFPKEKLILMIISALAAALVPIGLFIVESSTEGNFAAFLQVSFDRAYLPAGFLLVLLAITAIGSRKSDPPRPVSREMP